MNRTASAVLTSAEKTAASASAPSAAGSAFVMSVGSARLIDSSVIPIVAFSRPRRLTMKAPGTIAATEPANMGIRSQ